MNIALIDGDAVLQVGPYKELFANTSFPPSGPSDEFLADNNAKRINLWRPYDANTEKLVACAPYIEGEWVYTVTVEPLTPEELQARIESQWSTVRAQRNALLQGCDWTQLSDSPVDKTEWATYRQQLRDVTTQAGFPWEVVWPVAPVN
jgi:hypothetical protein